MGARETLLRRIKRSGTTATVSCGALGEMTVEALSLRDAALLSHKADGDRAVFFAACRELQALGEELRERKELFRPEEIMAYVSDEEAAEAASVIRQLSGWEDSAAPSAEKDVAVQKSIPVSASTELSSTEVAVPFPAQAEIRADVRSPLQEPAGTSAMPDQPISGAAPVITAEHVGPVLSANADSSADFGGGTVLSASLRPSRGRFSGPDAAVTAKQAEQVARFLAEGLRRAKQVR